MHRRRVPWKLILTTVAMTAMPAIARAAAVENNDVEYYVWNGFEPVVRAFEMISYIFGHDDFKTLLLAASAAGTLCGAMAMYARGLAAGPGQVRTAAWVVPGLAGMAIYTGLFVPTGTVHVFDPVVNRMQEVANVPKGVMWVAGTLNAIERRMVEIIETAAPPGPGRAFSSGAGGTSLAVLTAFLKPLERDAFIAQNVDQYVGDCVQFELMRPGTTLSLQELANDTDDLLVPLAKANNPAVYTVHYSAASKNGAAMTCQEGWTALRADLVNTDRQAALVADACKRAGFDTSGALAQAQTAQCGAILEAIVQEVTGVATTKETFAGQVISAQQIAESFISKGMDVGVSTEVLRQPVAQGVGMLVAAQEWLPILKATMTALSITLIPVLALFLPTPIVGRALLTMIGFFVWTAAWGVTDALMHSFVMEFSLRAFAGATSSKLGIANILAMPSQAAKAMSIFAAMRMTGLTVASFLSMLLIKFGGHALTSTISGAMSSINQGATAGGQMATPEGMSAKLQSLMGAVPTLAMANEHGAGSMIQALRNQGEFDLGNRFAMSQEGSPGATALGTRKGTLDAGQILGGYDAMTGVSRELGTSVLGATRQSSKAAGFSNSAENLGRQGFWDENGGFEGQKAYHGDATARAAEGLAGEKRGYEGDWSRAGERAEWGTAVGYQRDQGAYRALTALGAGRYGEAEMLKGLRDAYGAEGFLSAAKALSVATGSTPEQAMQRMAAAPHHKGAGEVQGAGAGGRDSLDALRRTSAVDATWGVMGAEQRDALASYLSGASGGTLSKDQSAGVLAAGGASVLAHQITGAGGVDKFLQNAGWGAGAATGDRQMTEENVIPALQRAGLWAAGVPTSGPEAAAYLGGLMRAGSVRVGSDGQSYDFAVGRGGASVQRVGQTASGWSVTEKTHTDPQGGQIGSGTASKAGVGTASYVVGPAGAWTPTMVQTDGVSANTMASVTDSGVARAVDSFGTSTNWANNHNWSRMAGSDSKSERSAAETVGNSIRETLGEALKRSHGTGQERMYRVAEQIYAGAGLSAGAGFDFGVSWQAKGDGGWRGTWDNARGQKVQIALSAEEGQALDKVFSEGRERGIRNLASTSEGLQALSQVSKAVGANDSSTVFGEASRSASNQAAFTGEAWTGYVTSRVPAAERGSPEALFSEMAAVRDQARTPEGLAGLKADYASYVKEHQPELLSGGFGGLVTGEGGKPVASGQRGVDAAQAAQHTAAMPVQRWGNDAESRVHHDTGHVDKKHLDKEPTGPAVERRDPNRPHEKVEAVKSAVSGSVDGSTNPLAPGYIPRPDEVAGAGPDDPRTGRAKAASGNW